MIKYFAFYRLGGLAFFFASLAINYTYSDRCVSANVFVRFYESMPFRTQPLRPTKQHAFVNHVVATECFRRHDKFFVNKI